MLVQFHAAVLRRLFPVLLTGFLLVHPLCFPASADDRPATRTEAPLTILQINDVYAIAPVDGGKAGGLARVGALKKEIASSSKSVVLLMAGDFLSPSVASSIFKGKQMVEALNAAGLDIATLGNHEFDFGPDILRERMKEAKWQWVVSNVFDEATGKPLGDAAPYLIRRHGPLTVGYLGLCLSGDEISRKNLRGIRIEDPFQAAARLIPEVKRAGADVIVAITHLNYIDDRRLAERFPEIDVIIGGHEHFPITSLVKNTLISKAGSDARFVARIDLGRAADTPNAPLERHFELLPVTDAIKDEPATAAVVADYESRLSKELDVVVGSTRTPLDAVAESVRARETGLGSLIADAMRQEVQADVALLNAGSIRSNRVYPPGRLIRRDLLAINPFGSIVCKVEVDGRTLLAALNHGVSRLGESVGQFPQVSGITFAVDAAAPPGDRVRDARVNGQPLDPNRRYTIAVLDYVLEGGDGYRMFEQGKVLVGPDSGDVLVSVLERFVRAAAGGEIGPQVEGRIRLPGASAVTAVAAVGAAATVPSKRPMILDTDMGIDSVIGMLYLIKAPEADLRAITIAHGIADVDAGTRNALGILEMTGRSAVPVAKGRRTPLRGKRSFPAFWREQANTLGGAKLPPATARARREPAEDLILETLEKSVEPVTIVAMGPLTNIALALQKRPDAAKKIREIVVIGGAVGVPGNVDKPFVGIKNSVAEWNIYLDPDAARQVFASGVPIRLLPLDATRALPVTPAFVQKVRTAKRDQTADLLLSLLEAVSQGIEGGWYFFWDALAAVVAARPEVMATHDARLEVVTAEGPALGQTRAVPTGGAPVRVGEEINREAFEEHLLKTILQ